MKDYDVAIIGAGIGGLTAGALLTKLGQKILIPNKNLLIAVIVERFRLQ